MARGPDGHDDEYRRPTVRELRVSNYRSLGDDITVTFDDMTVLVGPNGSGKSNVLDVFRFLREALTFGLEPAVSKRLGIARLRRVSTTKPRAVKVAVDLQAGDAWLATYEVQLNATKGASYRVEREHLRLRLTDEDDVVLDVEAGRVREAPAGLAPRASGNELVLPGLAGDPAIRPVVEALRSIRVHSIFPRELSQPQLVGVAPPLDDTGSNWCAVLKAMDRGAMRELAIAMERVTGDITDVRVESAGGYYTAEFEHRLSTVTRWFSAGQESDGTLRLAGILTALLQAPVPPVLGIEEPELTINPGLLPLLYEYLEAASRRTQILITTHSPDLLDMVSIDRIRAVQRVDGASTVGTVSQEQLNMVRNDLLSAAACSAPVGCARVARSATCSTCSPRTTDGGGARTSRRDPGRARRGELHREPRGQDLQGSGTPSGTVLVDPGQSTIRDLLGRHRRPGRRDSGPAAALGRAADRRSRGHLPEGRRSRVRRSRSSPRSALPDGCRPVLPRVRYSRRLGRRPARWPGAEVPSGTGHRDPHRSWSCAGRPRAVPGRQGLGAGQPDGRPVVQADGAPAAAYPRNDGSGIAGSGAQLVSPT